MGMKRYLLDSNMLSPYIDRREPVAGRVRDAIRQGCRVGTCEPVVAEMLFGLQLSSQPEKNIARLMIGLRQISCWPLDRAASQAYGQLAADLRRMGRPMQTIDIMLAAIAISLGNCAVVSTDSDLLAVPGLSDENWEASQL
jgi:tRNA(fMet)-specific endonuclease VapC